MTYNFIAQTRMVLQVVGPYWFCSYYRLCDLDRAHTKLAMLMWW